MLYFTDNFQKYGSSSRNDEGYKHSSQLIFFPPSAATNYPALERLCGYSFRGRPFLLHCAGVPVPTPTHGFLFFLLKILPFKCLSSKATCQIKHCLSASFDKVIILKHSSLFIVWCLPCTLISLSLACSTGTSVPTPGLSFSPGRQGYVISICYCMSVFGFCFKVFFSVSFNSE